MGRINSYEYGYAREGVMFELNYRCRSNLETFVDFTARLCLSLESRAMECIRVLIPSNVKDPVIYDEDELSIGAVDKRRTDRLTEIRLPVSA